MSHVAVTGATGFIGRHLLRDLAMSGQRVRALTRRLPQDAPGSDNVEWIVGDIVEPATWHRLLEPGCTVINLAYSRGSVASVAVETMRRMIEACGTGRIARFVHCSTVSVYGRASETKLTETSACNPVSEYGRIKLAVEHELIHRATGRFEFVIVRPSAVFGVGGEALVKLIGDLEDAPRLINYLRSSLFGRRRTHLVSVETVVAALRFLGQPGLAVDAETFIVSDDEDPINNFRDVERILMEELGVPSYGVVPPPLPRQLLETLMRLRGRANINTLTEYRCDKLLRRGFVKPVTLERALRRFASVYRREHGSRGAT